ncbi:hypothetical protein SAMN02990966_06212 [Rhodospirillales bacterium URHD0017]|nr:hypothetical protein SAMN02990966_06212 [Rhodospirillales bacterium URHD0017]
MRTLLIAVAALMLAGCSENSIWSKANNAWGTGTFPVSNDGQAALYIVREPAFPDAPAINITVGRQPLVGLTAPNWVRLDLPPRLYDLRAYGPQTNSELIITVAPGQTRFLLAQPTPTGGAELMELSQEQGRKLVRKGERLWTPEIDSEY